MHHNVGSMKITQQPMTVRLADSSNYSTGIPTRSCIFDYHEETITLAQSQQQSDVNQPSDRLQTYLLSQRLCVQFVWTACLSETSWCWYVSSCRATAYEISTVQFVRVHVLYVQSLARRVQIIFSSVMHVLYSERCTLWWCFPVWLTHLFSHLYHHWRSFDIPKN